MDAASTRHGGTLDPDPFAGLVVPQVLEETLQRHRDNLARLIVTLQSAGVSQAKIEESVSAVVSSYKEELLEAIKIMVII